MHGMDKRLGKYKKWAMESEYSMAHFIMSYLFRYLCD